MHNDVTTTLKHHHGYCVTLDTLSIIEWFSMPRFSRDFKEKVRLLVANFDSMLLYFLLICKVFEHNKYRSLVHTCNIKLVRFQLWFALLTK